MQVTSIQNQGHVQAIIDADQTRELHVIYPLLVDIIKEHGYTLQQIEQTLRDNRCWSYLIARKKCDSMTDQVEFKLPNDATEKTYCLFLSTRNPQEVLEESKTYEENFEKLSETGFAKAKDENTSSLDMFSSGTVQFADDQGRNQSMETLIARGYQFHLAGIAPNGELIFAITPPAQQQTQQRFYCTIV